MAALLEQLEQPAAVVGISYGGFVAWQLSYDHPELVSRIVMVDSPGPIFTRDDAEQPHARFGETSMADIFAPRSADDMKRLLGVGYVDPPWAPRFALSQYHRALIEPHVEQQRGLMDDLEERARSGALRVEAELPVLTVWGREDAVFPLEQAERLAQFVGGRARLVCLENLRIPVPRPRGRRCRTGRPGRSRSGRRSATPGDRELGPSVLPPRGLTTSQRRRS
jgi:pimeloyl-ACP methyl ester carboxylesterase